MISMKTLLRKFPEEWMELFAQLCSRNNPLRVAELWYQFSKSSRRGAKLSWPSFMEACFEKEPTIIDGQLEFIPRFLCFPVKFNRLLIAFIQHHKSEIGRSSLQELIDAVSCSELMSDEVVKQLLQPIQESLPTDSAENPNGSAESNAAQTAAPMDFSTPETSVRRPLEEPNTAEPLTKRARLDLSQDLEDSPIDLISLSPGSTAEKDTPGSDCLSEELVEKTNQLLESIRSKSDPGRNYTEFLLTCSNHEIELVCKRLDPGNLSESAVASLCQQVTNQASLSYFCTLTLARTILLFQLENMDKASSRVTLGTFQIYSKHFPRQLIEGAVVPYLHREECGVHQSELIVKLRKESFSDDLVIEMLLMFFKGTALLWSDGLLTVMRNFIDKINLPAECVSKMLVAMETNSIRHAHNKIFGKFIFDFINKYIKQFSASQLAQITQITEHHKSFFSEKIERAIKKAK